MNLPEGWPTDEMVGSGVEKLNNGWYINADETCCEIFKAMFSAAPTPPAQEDEPVAWLNPSADSYAPLDMHVHLQNPHDGKWIPLYTRPDDKLRKAAEELLRILDQTYVGCSAKDSMESLRAALEEK